MAWLLVTGGTGYIGSLLVPRLRERYDKIVVLDPCLFGKNKIDKIPNVIILNKGSKEFRESEWYKKEKCAGVIHLGGLSNDPMVDQNLEASMGINIDLTMKLVDWACERNLPKFVYASSASVYGYSSDNIVTEKSELNPQSAYARSKIKSEEYIRSKLDNFVIVRKGTLMGHSIRMRFDLVVNTMCWYAFRTGKIRLFSGGESWRPLAHVKDAAKMYDWIFHADWDRISKETFNFAHKNYRISELGLFIRHLIKNDPIYPRELEIEPLYDMPEQRSYRISSEKIDKFGVFPETGLTITVREMWQNLNANKYDAEDIIHWSAKWLENCKRVCNMFDEKFHPLETYV